MARPSSRLMRPLLLSALAGGLVALGAGMALAQDVALPPSGGDLLGSLSQALDGLTQGAGGAAGGSQTLSGRILQLIAVMTVISIAPGLLVVMTSFTRFVIVFSMLRSALGLNQTPPNMVLSALALFMTIYVMQPVFDDAWSNGLQPLLEGTETEQQALPAIAAPFHAFMAANTRELDMRLFLNLTEADQPMPEDLSEVRWSVLVPAFMISEMRRAFTIGFLVYLPFIAIDLIVASVLMAAGMMMLPPVMISLPLKVIFFVLIDGWYMLAGSLMQSYAAAT
ncbi:flagellar type III secretion system pore protein FliP [Frigidibacter sp. MR17.24]|uniref:flagellar type III secretion system pore protein FliP n=1 Tax=Frigidibacter sp. MR17.24 TaxID=3127345 RepID=UPI0030130B42